ncbi:MAG: electron transport complex protein RnfC [Oleiphilaceae bacterium]|jgi:electron transport complex protein RnfC
MSTSFTSPTNASLSSKKISTRTIYDFHGGIHPEEMKTLSNQTPITHPPIPPKLVLPLQQHIGKPSDLIVELGQHVLKGQKLANADGMISVALHAPTSGIIESIIDHPIAHPSGESGTCIVLIPDGKDEWCELEPCQHYEHLSVSKIQAKVRDAGVAGMGGAGFPTEVKLHPPRQDKVATLILNAAECEPYITADDRLMRERADEVVQGMEIMAYALQPGECIIGIEDNKPEAIAALREAAKETNIDVCVIPTKYPSGGEKQIIKILTDKEVPNGKIPADIGVMCQNVGTAAAIYRAVRFGEPLISRVTTLTGEGIEQPGNVEALIGTPIDWLLSQYGFQAQKTERLIMGGPMMGFTLKHIETPIVKTTNCILAPTRKDLPPPPPAQACIRCGLCADVCPAVLLPQQLYWFSRAQEYDKAEHHNLFDCIECGACSYVCPSSIPLVQYYRHAKGEIKQQKQDQLKSDQARERFEARQFRLEREQAEKDAKRKARADAAAKTQAAKKAAEAAKPNEVATKTDTTLEDAADTKKAVIQAALARNKEKNDSNNALKPEEATDLDALKTAWDKTQAKLDKMYDALDDARANNPEQIDKLSRAVEKNQMRVNQAKQIWEKASASQQAASATTHVIAVEIKIEKPDIALLATAIEKAQSKLDKMQDALDNAQPEQIEKLTRAVEKNKVRVNQAQQVWEEASANQIAEPKTEISMKATITKEAVSGASEQPDIEALESGLEKAQSKLETMQDALDSAQPDQIEKLTRAVEKNKVRVQAAENALKAVTATRVTNQNGEQ